MADNDLYLLGTDQIQANYEKYKDKFADANSSLINQETFLKLLVAEMSNQDPLEPTSNTEFISQLATFSSMQYMQDASKYSMANYAASLAGKTVTATKMEGAKAVIKTGVVEKVVATKDSYTVTVDGETYSLSQITSVLGSASEASEEKPSEVTTNNALGDSIAKAASLVGMYVTVPNGNSTISGWVDSIRVKDGKISAVVTDYAGNKIGDGEYPIEQITEMTINNVIYSVPDIDNTGNTDNTENSDNTEDTATPDETVGDLVEETNE